MHVQESGFSEGLHNLTPASIDYSSHRETLLDCQRQAIMFLLENDDLRGMPLGGMMHLMAQLIVLYRVFIKRNAYGISMQTQLMLHSRATWLIAAMVFDDRGLYLFDMTVAAFVASASGLVYYFSTTSDQKLRATVTNEPLYKPPMAMYLTIPVFSIVVMIRTYHFEASVGMGCFLALVGAYRLVPNDPSVFRSFCSLNISALVPWAEGLMHFAVWLQGLLCFASLLIFHPPRRTTTTKQQDSGTINVDHDLKPFDSETSPQSEEGPEQDVEREQQQSDAPQVFSAARRHAVAATFVFSIGLLFLGFFNVNMFYGFCMTLVVVSTGLVFRSMVSDADSERQSGEEACEMDAAMDDNIVRIEDHNVPSELSLGGEPTAANNGAGDELGQEVVQPTAPRPLVVHGIRVV